MYSKKIIQKNRKEQIKYILEKLQDIKKQSSKDTYAIDQNILFFKSIQSIPRYIKWLYGARKKIQNTKLLEINEILPELNEEFHLKMSLVERQARPGIISPLVDGICSVAKKDFESKRFRVASLGSGSMEVERQSIERLYKESFDKSMTIVGFDSSKNTREFALKNISSLPYARVVLEDKLTESKMIALEKETRESVLVIIAGNNIFSLEEYFRQNTFSLVMTALFLHHLPMTARINLIVKMRSFAKNIINYDGYQNEMVLPLISFTGWNNPVFLNAAIFSSIRFNTKNDIFKIYSDADVRFYKHGHYIAL